MLVHSQIHLGINPGFKMMTSHQLILTFYHLGDVKVCCSQPRAILMSELMQKTNNHYKIRVASTVDVVFLSYPNALHLLGAFPYAMKQFGLSAPVYATEPVYRLGLLTMYDHYISHKIVQRDKEQHTKLLKGEGKGFKQ
ncbi:uncharacterized protein [Spinacia oleracea]|uniref:Cleavage and polyadenylation specificity factor subunit 2 n=1 Tax=Spinacia oleracea TaxID=3562 RepID=A0ABM3QUE8_SPIOL|nr:uncharacterized protein LOC130462548 [Spinacia oleracea]XP_056692456.1 uncharacterized protein LOC110788074 [Spinacia oleracea]XP_056699645.1 uncharacterized protein LOC130472494 [Spinacia oleracea]